MNIEKIYKLIDNLEMTVLKGASVPFIPFVLTDINKFKDFFINIRSCIPEEINENESILYSLLNDLQAVILKGIKLPHTPFVLVNHEKIIDILDRIRCSIPGEIQKICNKVRK